MFASGSSRLVVSELDLRLGDLRLGTGPGIHPNAVLLAADFEGQVRQVVPVRCRRCERAGSLLVQEAWVSLIGERRQLLGPFSEIRSGLERGSTHLGGAFHGRRQALGVLPEEASGDGRMIAGEAIQIAQSQSIDPPVRVALREGPESSLVGRREVEREYERDTWRLPVLDGRIERRFAVVPPGRVDRVRVALALHDALHGATDLAHQ